MGSIGILVGTKGRGSNMQAIIRAFPNEVAVVIAPSEEAPALQVAQEQGISTAAIPFSKGVEYGAALLEALKDVEIVCLAGYMRLLPAEVLAAFSDRVLNIHPALLPKFGGKGMYGMHVHEAVIAAGEKKSGCTVHFVNEHYDEGAILLQKEVPVLPDDTAETLAARVLEQEHLAYPEAIRIVQERLRQG